MIRVALGAAGELRNKADLGRDSRIANCSRPVIVEASMRARPDGRGHQYADTYVPLRLHRRIGVDRCCGLAGAPLRHQPPRRQSQPRTDAAACGNRRRRGGWKKAPGAGPARQCRTPPDDRRPERHRGGTQYRARDAGAGPDGGRGLSSAVPSRPGSPRFRIRHGPRPMAAAPTPSILPSRRCRNCRGPRGPPSPTRSAVRWRRPCRSAAAIRSRALHRNRRSVATNQSLNSGPRREWNRGPSRSRRECRDLSDPSP